MIWESMDIAEEFEWQTIPASDFIEGTNTGWTSFAYFNEINHGDVALVEFWGHPAGASAAADEPAADEPEEVSATPAEVEDDAAAAVVEDIAVPAADADADDAADVAGAADPGPATAPVEVTADTPKPAPPTGNMGIIVALAVLGAAALVAVKLAGRKNKNNA